MTGSSPAQVYSLVIGSVLLVAGVIGFFYSASFATGSGVEREAVLGILDVNGWHNALHIVSGGLGLLLAGSFSGARAYAIGMGLAYLLLATVGLVLGTQETLVDLVPLNTQDNVFHLLVALAGIGAFFATPAVPGPTLEV